eukprot:CAMPEP_0182534748 /NCGR_PEP_ID=MMETSP1323-20130603/16432_1 /TAXON_ID=236787 /ORGANISM="Florenciella parvula, Strain RCC1693" /LENGTH=60 /DNA_ID=CAMNT_0024744803 /DNA_START=264 /DNA_END=443 /DNA_ORIENTATION=-
MAIPTNVRLMIITKRCSLPTTSTLALSIFSASLAYPSSDGTSNSLTWLTTASYNDDGGDM